MKKNQKANSLKNIPVFKNEAEELNFWSKNDTTDYFEFSSKSTAAFPNLKYSTESISIRLPKSLLNNVKSIANKKDVPYQSLIKVYLADKVNEELNKYL
jgi:predicted DNA binding CopG/RHH family protein